MERLVDRARAAMNLLLVISLVGLMAVAKKPIDILSLAEDLYRYGSEFPAEYSFPEIYSFIDAVENSDGGDLTERIARTRISVLLSDSVDPRGESIENGRVDTNGEIRRDPIDTREPALVIMTGPKKLDNESLGEYLQRIPITGSNVNLLERREQIREFQRIVSDAQLIPAITFGKAQDELTPKFSIPIINQDVPVTNTLLFLALGSFGLLLYLFSLCATMRQIAPQTDRMIVTDWIFFHAKSFGRVLGSLWIAGPVLTVLLGVIVFKTVNWPAGLLVAFVLSCVVAAIIFQILETRRSFIN